MIRIKDLSFSYDENINILEDISFDIEKGKIYCLLGVNGAGKTTLFNCITGFLPSNIKFNEDIKTDHILYIHDRMKFYKNLSGDEFLRLIFSIKNKKIDDNIYSDLLGRFKMNKHIHNLISTYSLGTKQKLVLIIGFLLKYEYIFMDEPFSSIDFMSAEILIEIMRKYAHEDNSIVISTHRIDVAYKIADEILLLDRGNIYQKKNEFNNSDEIKNWIRTLSI